MGQSDVPFSNAACNIGVIFDSQLALKELVNKLWQLAYLEIRRVGLIRHYLSFESSSTLLSSLVLSRLDYCNALLAGSQVLLDKIQRVISCSARLLFQTPKSAHFTPLLYGLHWQPDSIQNSSRLLPHCFWYSSSIPL